MGYNFFYFFFKIFAIICSGIVTNNAGKKNKTAIKCSNQNILIPTNAFYFGVSYKYFFIFLTYFITFD